MWCAVWDASKDASHWSNLFHTRTACRNDTAALEVHAAERQRLIKRVANHEKLSARWAPWLQGDAQIQAKAHIWFMGAQFPSTPPSGLDHGPNGKTAVVFQTATAPLSLSGNDICQAGPYARLATDRYLEQEESNGGARARGRESRPEQD